MVYDNKKGKGVRKKFLPEPNPVKIELLKDSTIFDVFQKSIELFYSGFNVSVNDVMLADSTGNQITTDDDISGWRLGKYYLKNKLIPSRHKLYTMIDLSEVIIIIKVL